MRRTVKNFVACRNMSVRGFAVWIVAAAFIAPLVLEAADNLASGIISEKGRGTLVLKEKDNLSRKFLERRKDTTYEPDVWRPKTGDEVEIKYIQREKDLLATSIRLTKVGPSNVDLSQLISPLEITIQEIGNGAIFALVGNDLRRIRFGTSSSTQYEPVGWKPQVGDKVIVTFTINHRSSIFFSDDFTLTTQRIEKKP